MREYGLVARTYTHTWLAVNAPPRKLVTFIVYCIQSNHSTFFYYSILPTEQSLQIPQLWSTCLLLHSSSEVLACQVSLITDAESEKVCKAAQKAEDHLAIKAAKAQGKEALIAIQACISQAAKARKLEKVRIAAEHQAEKVRIASECQAEKARLALENKARQAE
jgi:hypothetical protein